jgi:hypothetical protein
LDTRRISPAPRYGRRYPWGAWFSKRRLTLWKGRDYNGRTDTFAQQIRSIAPRHGVSVSIRIAADGNSLCLTVYPKAEGEVESN